MECDEARLLFVPQLIGDLDEASSLSQNLKEHLAECWACAREYEREKKYQEAKGLFATK